jgi:hypothetical protein
VERIVSQREVMLANQLAARTAQSPALL